MGEYKYLHKEKQKVGKFVRLKMHMNKHCEELKQSSMTQSFPPARETFQKLDVQLKNQPTSKLPPSINLPGNTFDPTDTDDPLLGQENFCGTCGIFYPYEDLPMHLPCLQA
jgi:hypothetical protein